MQIDASTESDPYGYSFLFSGGLRPQDPFNAFRVILRTGIDVTLCLGVSRSATPPENNKKITGGVRFCTSDEQIQGWIEVRQSWGKVRIRQVQERNMWGSVELGEADYVARQSQWFMVSISENNIYWLSAPILIEVMINRLDHLRPNFLEVMMHWLGGCNHNQSYQQPCQSTLSTSTSPLSNIWKNHILDNFFYEILAK